LSFHYTTYRYVRTSTAGDWKYLATVEARDGDDLNLGIDIALSPDDHEQRVDFLPPTERERDQHIVEHSSPFNQ
jgi:hypothetical protein